MAGAIRFVLERRGFRPATHGRLPVLRRLDAETGGFEFRKCAANANAYAHAEQLVAVIGTVVVVLRRGRDPDPEPGARAGRSR